MGLCQQLVRCAVTRERLIFYSAVVYITAIYVAYGIYISSRRTGTNKDNPLYLVVDDLHSSAERLVDVTWKGAGFSKTLSSLQNDVRQLHDGKIVIAIG